MINYKGNELSKEPEPSEFSCSGCFFSHTSKKMVNVGLKTKPELKEIVLTNRGCSAPNIEPFRSCKSEHIIFKQI